MFNKFSFSEDEQKNIINIYEDSIESSNNETEYLVDELITICNRTKYLPIVNFTQNILLFYNEELKTIINNHYNEWISSNSSLSYFVNEMEGGEDALNVAKNLEYKLRETIEQLKTNTNNINYDTANIEITEADYEELKNLTTSYMNNIENIRLDFINKIMCKSEDNAAFLVVKGVINETLNSIIKAFDEFTSIVEKGKDDFNQKLNKNIDNIQAFNSYMESQVDNQLSEFKSLAKMFESKL